MVKAFNVDWKCVKYDQCMSSLSKIVFNHVSESKFERGFCKSSLGRLNYSTILFVIARVKWRSATIMTS